MQVDDNMEQPPATRVSISKSRDSRAPATCARAGRSTAGRSADADLDRYQLMACSWQAMRHASPSRSPSSPITWARLSLARALPFIKSAASRVTESIVSDVAPAPGVCWMHVEDR